MLTAVDISDIQHDDMREGWVHLFNALRSPNCSLRDLNMKRSGLDDDLVALLSNSLLHNRGVRRLNLHGNTSVSSSGWEPLSRVFRCPAVLEKVDLGQNRFDDGVLVSFANSLTRNSELKELYLDIDVEEVDKSTLDTFMDVLCNQSSLMDTYGSNHVLQRLYNPDEQWLDDDGNDIEPESLLPPRLVSLLRINREGSRADAARRKIIMVHFSDHRGIRHFFSMKLKVLPHAIAWMAKDDLGRSSLMGTTS